MFLRIRLIAITLSICLFFNSYTSRAGIGALEPNLQMFAVQFCAIMMGIIFKPTTLQTILRNLRGEEAQHLTADEQRIADLINAKVENEAEVIISEFAHLSIGTFTVTVINSHKERIEISSEQYNRIRSLNPTLANLMPIPYPGEPVLVEIPQSILQALVHMTSPVAQTSIETAWERAYEEETVELLNALQVHVNTFSSLISNEGFFVTLNLLLQIEQLSYTHMLLFRGEEGEGRYRESLSCLLEDYRRILAITDPNTSTDERKRLLQLLIKQYEEDRDYEYSANPLTNHYQNQLGAVRYLMHETVALMNKSSDLLEKLSEDIKKKKKGKQPIEQELKAVRGKSEELKRINGFLVKCRALLQKIEEERLALFLALKKILQT